MNFSRLKTFFIPGQENDFKPHALRIKTTLIFLSVVLLIEIIILVQSLIVFPTSGFLASVLPDVVVHFVNEQRENSLVVSPILQQAAQEKADHMASQGYFSHMDPQGRYPWYWIKKAGYQYSTAGENLAIHFFDSKDLVQAWMDSPAHRANIVNSQFTETGIGISQGTYENKNTIFIVQFFGKPLAKTAATPPPQNNSPAVPAVPTAASVAQNSEVLGATDVTEPSLVSEIVSAPRTSAVALYATLLTIVLLVFFLNIFIHIKIQRSEALVDGVLMLVCVGSILLLNSSLSFFRPVGL